MAFDSTSAPVPDLSRSTSTVRPNQAHYQRASQLLQRADELLAALDDGSWSYNEGAVELSMQLELVTRLGQAHATLGASR